VNIMSYLATMATLISEAKNQIHESHIYEFEYMVRQMIEELTPKIVKETLLDTYMELYVKIKMLLDGKEVSFDDINEYIMNEIQENLIKSLSKL